MLWSQNFLTRRQKVLPQRRYGYLYHDGKTLPPNSWHARERILCSYHVAVEGGVGEKRLSSR